METANLNKALKHITVANAKIGFILEGIAAEGTAYLETQQESTFTTNVHAEACEVIKTYDGLTKNPLVSNNPQFEFLVKEIAKGFRDLTENFARLNTALNQQYKMAG